MKILVIGSGGREHALCWKIKQSSRTEKLYCMPGNAGTAKFAVNVDIDIRDNDAVKMFCEEKSIGLVVVGPEVPLARGITDVLENGGIKVCGPSYAASRLESSKMFSKEQMGRRGVPTASFRIFDDIQKAEEHIKSVGAPIVVKADGLAAGKGVIVAKTEEEALQAAKAMLEDKTFGAAGHKIIVEECLEGEEASVMVLSDGTNIIPLESSQDHKRAYDGDKGPNTGGMGAYSPAPVVTEEVFKRIKEEVLQPIVDGLREEGMPYKGLLYAGIMMTDEGPKVLEFNVRFGDPEAQVILPRLKSDFVDLLEATADGDLSGVTPEWESNVCACVVLASKGYPGEYEKGLEIKGTEEAEKEGVIVFNAGTKMSDGQLVTSGGRVLNVVGKGRDIKEAMDNIYKGIEKISFDGMHYRKDIGYRAIARMG